LRAAQLGGSNLELDWEHLAEEIEDLGISQRSALRSEIRRIIRHIWQSSSIRRRAVLDAAG
jgi:hypothetical protein